MIPKTFLSEIGSVAPFSIENGTFYQISNVRTGKKNEKQISINHLDVFAVPSVSISEMETLYFEQNSEEIHAFQDEFIKTAIKNANLYSKKDIDDFLKKNGAAGFIINEIFPYFIENQSDITKLLDGEEIPKQKEKDKGSHLDVLVEDLASAETVDFSVLKEKIMRGLEQTEEKKTEASKKQKAKEAVAVSEDDEVKALLSSRRGGTPPPARLDAENFQMESFLSGSYVVILGNVYKKDNRTYSYFCPLADLEKSYCSHLEKKIKLEAIDKYREQIETLKDVERKNRAIQKIVGKDSLEVGDIGFIKTEGGHYVYLKVPEYILRSGLKDGAQNDNYYQFKPCRVAMRIVSDGTNVQFDRPVVLEDYRHPFLPGSGRMQNICLGDYNFPSSARTNTQKIVDMLSTAQKVIMRGYIGGTRPHNHLSESLYGKHLISKEEFKRKKLTASNEW